MPAWLAITRIAPDTRKSIPSSATNNSPLTSPEWQYAGSHSDYFLGPFPLPKLAKRPALTGSGRPMRAAAKTRGAVAGAGGSFDGRPRIRRLNLPSAGICRAIAGRLTDW